MFPSLSCLFLLFGLLLCLPLGVFSLPLLALEKRLYLREQDTGQNHMLAPFCYVLHAVHKGNTSPYGHPPKYLHNVPAIWIYLQSGDFFILSLKG